MNKTKIEWCDATWNPVTGCLHGCEYCYARRSGLRQQELYSQRWEPKKPKDRRSSRKHVKRGK